MMVGMGCWICHFPHTDFLLNNQPPSLSFSSFNGFGFRFQLRFPKERLKLVTWSSSSSSQMGLDSQNLQSEWIGPVPGDIAQVEAFCRIFRCAQQLHASIMDTLCNPLTGECTVSYQLSSEEQQLLEEKVVALLGCLLALLNQGRDTLLAGTRSSSFPLAHHNNNNLDDNLTPLATFRSDMKTCCHSLHLALHDYLSPTDARTIPVWRKLQSLKNVCYDVGFPRGDESPCHTLFANWDPVYLSTKTQDQTPPDQSQLAFWTGGQVTNQGLEWLIHKGFKTIVDLRANILKDDFYHIALENAVSSAKIQVIRLPVQVGIAPSMEQVEMFASLVSDSTKNPLYLHSQEGVSRTSAMVSRWRQYMARSESQFTLSTNPTQIPSHNKTLTPSKLQGDNPSLTKDSDITHASNIVSNKEVSKTGNIEHQSENDGVNVGSFPNFSIISEPLKSQFPTCNVFSKREMSKIFKNRKISPATFFNYQRKRLEASLVPSKNSNVTDQKENFSGGSGSKFMTEGNLNGVLGELSKPQNLSVTDGKYINGETRNSFHIVANGDEGKANVGALTNISSYAGERVENNVMRTVTKEETNGNGIASIVSVDKKLELIEGDMCASTTGVVRVQSRKKAEMFLVRTDGISCNREMVTESSLAFTHPSTQQQMLMWKSPPKTVLLLKKLGEELMGEAKQVASFLYYQENMNVLVEPDVHDIFARIPGFGFVQTFYNQDTSDLHERVDFVACLGGDGVILHASNLFRGAVPPVVSFNLGSLGFLTSHNFDDYRQDLRQLIHGNNTVDGVYITLRMRLRCEIFRNGKAMPGKVFDVLNEIVVDRGSNPYLSKIECYEHNRLITKVQGDGVIVATPTGSTAYSTAAGGSMVHPNVPCMLFTPICPHSLSFRPVILPDSAQLELKIPDDCRSNAWVSFDGKRRQQLSRGHSVRICMSKHPLPTVNKSDQTGDWFHSLIRCLNWNERLDQKAL